MDSSELQHVPALANLLIPLHRGGRHPVSYGRPALCRLEEVRDPLTRCLTTRSSQFQKEQALGSKDPWRLYGVVLWSLSCSLKKASPTSFGRVCIVFKAPGPLFVFCPGLDPLFFSFLSYSIFYFALYFPLLEPFTIKPQSPKGASLPFPSSFNFNRCLWLVDIHLDSLSISIFSLFDLAIFSYFLLFQNFPSLILLLFVDCPSS